MKETIKSNKLLLIIILSTLGGYYSFLQDLTALFPFQSNTPWINLLARITLSILVVFFVVFITIFFPKIIKKKIFILSGFQYVYKRWFPREKSSRIIEGEKFFKGMVETGDKNFFIDSVSGEWDIRQPIPEKDFIKYCLEKKLSFKVLLAHPQSEALKKRGLSEENQSLTILQHRIVSNTKFLMRLKSKNIPCDVRWYINSPKFHILANDSIMYFSPFVDGIPGHDTMRYQVGSTDSFYKALYRFFEDEWSNALIPEHEMQWAERNILRTKAVFLDRDNTLIKDISYNGDMENAKIEILPGVIEGLKLLIDHNFRLIIISNQEPVGIKITDKSELNLLTKRIKDKFRDNGINFDAFYYCTHSRAEACSCQKPRSGLLKMAINDFNLNISDCFFIGDSEKDVLVGKELPELSIHQVTDSNSFLSITRAIVNKSDAVLIHAIGNIQG